MVFMVDEEVVRYRLWEIAGVSVDDLEDARFLGFFYVMCSIY
jgi:hypothetical protein